MQASRHSLLALTALLAACGQSHLDTVDPPEPGMSASALIGAEGGMLEVGDLELRIPGGALSEPTEIRVIVTETPAPSGFTAFGPIVRFEPEGLAFAAPIELRVPFRGDERTATIFWSARERDAYVPRATRIEGGFAIASSTHFSSAFVGTACSGEHCCDQANGDVDVLLVIDDSNSMSEEQALLEAQIPRLARVLATGDVDGDGVQDFPAIENLHVGIVSSDMGSAGFTTATCGNGAGGFMFGHDGVLRDAGAGCMATGPVAAVGADASDTEIDAFVTQVSCVGRQGVGGCGFEQQLDAMLKALVPSTMEIEFVFGTGGHADGLNAGFLRPASILAVVEVTDEDDCSVLDPDLLNTSSVTYGSTDLNLRCFTYGDAVQPTARYVDALLDLRSDPADVVFAAITGVPSAAVGELELSALLADPAMTPAVDPAMPTRVAPVCSSGSGTAFPARRISTVAHDIAAAGGVGLVHSICESDYTPAMTAILSAIAARASGSCAAP